jgi:hypothetical protein
VACKKVVEALVLEWRDISGYEGSYQVSNDGRVKSLARVVIRKDGRKQSVVEKILSASLNDKGYLHLSLLKNGKRKSAFIHKLVAITFIENPNGYRVVRHLNDIKTDNGVDNLAWGNHRDNTLDSIRNGRHATANRETCSRGHKYSEYGYYISATRPNSRYCKECARLRYMGEL